MNILKHLKRFFQFVKDLAADPRIPAHDKTVVAGLLVLLVSPVDLIPDWIPVFGWLDDFVIAALLLDYFFDVLDQEVILSHYPYGQKSFERVRALARLVTAMTPQPIKERLWTYKPVGKATDKTIVDVTPVKTDESETQTSSKDKNNLN